MLNVAWFPLGAVIAREFDIPAVSDVKAAIDVFHDGEQIVVDGARGIVYRSS